MESYFQDHPKPKTNQAKAVLKMDGPWWEVCLHGNMKRVVAEKVVLIEGGLSSGWPFTTCRGSSVIPWREFVIKYNMLDTMLSP